MFFYHGEKDRLVRPAAAQAMATALKKAGVDSQFYVVKGAGHIPAAVNKTAVAGIAGPVFPGVDFLVRNFYHVHPLLKPVTEAAEAKTGPV